MPWSASSSRSASLNPRSPNFARGVRRLPGQRDEPEDAADVHDVAAGAQGGQQGAGERDGGAEVHGEHLVELLHRHLVEPAGQRDPGVVDQQRHLGRGPQHAFCRRVQRAGITEVDDHLRDPRPGVAAAHLVGDRGEPLGVAVQQHERAPARREAVRELLPDAARRAGDDRGAAGEAEGVQSRHNVVLLRGGEARHRARPGPRVGSSPSTPPAGTVRPVSGACA